MGGLGMHNIKHDNSNAERKTQIHLLPQKQNLPCNIYVTVYKELKYKYNKTSRKVTKSSIN